MKIALVLECFDPQRGGLEQWTWQFARCLLELGHEVHVVACDFPTSDLGLPVVLHRVEKSKSPLQRAAAIEAVLLGLSFDVVHDMGCGWRADIFHPHGGSTRALHEHNLMRIPRWRQIRFWREKRYRELAEIERRQHACTGAVIVAVSRMVQDHFQTLHGVPFERMRLIPNGVDTERFAPDQCRSLRDAQRRKLGCRDDETLFLLVAHNLLLKNAEATIRAFARLTSGGAAARLVIVGGKRPKPFLKLTRKLGESERVTFQESVDDVRPYYAAADVHVHPTWYDPCSLVVLEALACGLPVITTRYNGVSEMMADGVEGYILANPADVPALAEKMNLLLQPELRLPMATAARKLATAHSFERQTREFLTLYREIARG